MFELIPSRHQDVISFPDYFEAFSKNFFNGQPAFHTDITEKQDRYILKADLPGFHKEDIKITISNNTLTIDAEHKEENKQETDRFVRRERKQGHFSRTFDMQHVASEAITASYINGVLELILPKENAGQPENSKQISIQ